MEAVLTGPRKAKTEPTPGGETADIAQQRLNECPYTSLRSVRCRFHEGVLTLTGIVPSFFIKQFAQECIRKSDRIEQIENRLIVLETSPIRGSIDACIKS